MLVKRLRNLGTDGKFTRIMVVVIKSMACYKDQLVIPPHRFARTVYIVFFFNELLIAIFNPYLI